MFLSSSVLPLRVNPPSPLGKAQSYNSQTAGIGGEKHPHSRFFPPSENILLFFPRLLFWVGESLRGGGALFAKRAPPPLKAPSFPTRPRAAIYGWRPFSSPEEKGLQPPKSLSCFFTLLPRLRPRPLRRGYREERRQYPRRWGRLQWCCGWSFSSRRRLHTPRPRENRPSGTPDLFPDC